MELVQLADDGLDDMFEYSCDPRLYEFLEFPPQQTKEETRAYLEKLKSRGTDGSAHYWFIRLIDSGKVIGTFGVHSIDWRKGAAAIGYGLSPAHWGHGYFQEALQLVLAHLFRERGFHRVTATTASEHRASLRALQRAGFVREGTLRDFYLSHRGNRFDAAVLALLSPDYEQMARSQNAWPGHTSTRKEPTPTGPSPRNPVGKYSGNELAYVTRALDSEDRSNKTHPWTQRFEEAFCQAIGSRHAIAHNSGTSALHSCLAAAGVRPGDEVIMPGLTVIMDAYAAIHLGGIPVFADVDPHTQNLDPEDVRRKITPKTRAIITVSLQGLAADVAPIMEMAGNHGISVVEDCAQAMLSSYPVGQDGWKYSGTVGHLGVFSFETKKHLSTGEGGMVVTDDPLLAERARKFGGLGYKNLTAQAGRMSILPSEFQDPAYERFDAIGLNYRMNELTAAVGLAQLERVHEIVARRRQVARLFHEAIEGCSWMVPQHVPEGYENTYYTFAVQYFGESALGLPWKVFWQRYIDRGGDGFYGACKVPYLEPVFGNLELAGKTYGPGLCPVAEEIQPRIMQFKTNYRDLDVAKRKTALLAELIDELGR